MRMSYRSVIWVIFFYRNLIKTAALSAMRKVIQAIRHTVAVWEIRTWIQ